MTITIANIPKTLEEVKANPDYQVFIKDLSDEAILAAMANLDSDLDGRYPDFVTMPIYAEDALKDYLLRTFEYTAEELCKTYYDYVEKCRPAGFLLSAYECLKDQLEETDDVFILNYKPYNIRLHKNDLLVTLRKELINNPKFHEKVGGIITDALEGQGYSDFAGESEKNPNNYIVVRATKFKGDFYNKQMML